MKLTSAIYLPPLPFTFHPFMWASSIYYGISKHTRPEMYVFPFSLLFLYAKLPFFFIWMVFLDFNCFMLCTHAQLLLDNLFKLHLVMPMMFYLSYFTFLIVYWQLCCNFRKIVLATNIAESSITIDDVVYVIDCGKAKETSYDALNKLACLLPSWISKASAHQVCCCWRCN